MTNPSHGGQGQPTQQPGASPPPPPPAQPAAQPQPPDVSWIEFDTEMRNQDPATIERKVIGPPES
jgi:hypothetical protein